MAAPSWALTPPALQLTDGVNTVTIDSTATATFSPGCACSTTAVSASSGHVAWSGVIGVFTVTNVNGRTKPSLGSQTSPTIDVGLSGLSTGSKGGTLTISWSDVGFDGLGPVTLNETTTVAGSGMAVYTGYVDPSNSVFGTASLVGTIGPTMGNGVLAGPGPTSEQFSMTAVETFTLGTFAFLLNDYQLIGTPVPPLTLSCSSASGVAGTAYNSSLMANGGVPAYTFSLLSGSLPPGVTLNSASGLISGTPTATGSYNFVTQVTDSIGDTASTASNGSCTIMITVPTPLGLACSASTGQVGVAYNSSLVATGGLPPYTMFSITPANGLPAGLFLNAMTGAITGTPTAAGPSDFTAEVVDSNGNATMNSATSSCNVVVSPSPITLTCSAVNSGEVGAPFNSPAPTVSGGTAPYTFSVAPGNTLPAGLTLNTSTGAITGTPTASGTFSIQVTDSKGMVGTSTCPYTIVSGPTLTCSAVTSGEVGAAFNSPAPTVSGGTAPYTFSLAPGSTLPAGLTLNTSTGAITGTPTAPGAFNIQVTDANGVVAASTCPYTVVAGPSLTCSSTNSGQVGAVFNSPALTVTGGTAPYTFSVAPGSTLPGGLTLNTSTGAITGTPTAPGNFNIQVTDAKGAVVATTCLYTISPPSSVTCSTTNSGEVGVAFNSPAPAVSGGTAPYTFSLAPASTLPAGLTLNTSTGAITGTPTAPGTFNIQVTDSKGVVVATTCLYTIVPAPSITCSTTNSGQVGVPFNSPAMTINGGTAPYTFSVATGTLPQGLTLNASTGAITGTPTAPGTFTIQVKDAAGAVSSSCAFTISPPSSITCSTTNSGEVGVPFNSPGPTVAGGTAPYTFSLAPGSTLPAGLTLNASTGAITGTPTAPGTFNIQVTDSKGVVVATTCLYTIVAAPSVTCSSTNSGEVGVALNVPGPTVTGGVAPYTFSIGTGTLPTGLTLNASTGAITGTAKVTGTFTIKVTDHSGAVATTTCQFVIVSHVSLACGMCGANKAKTGTAYSETLSTSGGTAPYTYSISSGSLPPGLTLNAKTGVVSGTPTTAGTYTFTSQVTDANGVVSTATCTIVVTGPPLDLECGSCGAGKATIGLAYSAQFAVTGGTAPFTYSLTSGSLPPGLTLNTSTGAIMGTPTTPGTYTFTTKVVDKNGSTDTTTCTIVVQASPVTLNCGPCSASKAMVGTPYSATMTVTGGTAPFTYSIVSGSLPPGLTLNSSTGTISGTPTAPGTYTVTAQVVDKNGYNDTDVCTIVVGTPPVNLTCGACGNSSGKVGTAYSTTLAISGGKSPFRYSIISGSLPPGLTLNTSTGAISGTPATAGSYSFTSKVVDANGNSDTATCTIVISGASINLNCGTCGTSQATVGSPYSATYSVVGGSAPFTYSIISGSLPAGLTLNSSTGEISGTPTKAGTYTFTAKVTDKHGNTDTQACTLVVAVSPIDLSCGSCGSGSGNGVVGTAYSASLSVSGGTGPYTYSIISGSLPNGLTLNSSTGTISGTPTAPGSFTFTSKVVDKNGATDTATCTIVIAAVALNLNCGTCGANQATVGVSYSATYSVAGGTGPFTYSIISGSLPAGLTLNSSTGTISGTPTTPGTYTFTAKVVDSNGKSDTQACTVVVIGPSITLNCGPCSAAKAWVGTPYSATMTVTGGTGPFTYSIVSGSLPPGLTLNSSTGTISGTPTTAGTYTLTAKVVDKNGKTDTDVCTIVVGSSPINLGCGSCMAGKATVGQGYSTTMSVTGGTAPYTFSIISGALPTGLKLNTSTGAITGAPTTQGTYTFTTQVVDKNGSTDTTTCTIEVDKSY